MHLLLSTFSIYSNTLAALPEGKLLINTINAHSFNIAQIDNDFAEALGKSDILLPDGISIVLAVRLINGLRLKKIAGADLFLFEMNRLNRLGGTCFFLGSSQNTLDRIFEKTKKEFPGITVSGFSPPYKPKFSIQDNLEMVSAVNLCKPDVLFIGMTAPKQEKWAYQHFPDLKAGHICCIGAVFDFYAGTIRRAPGWVIKIGFEWLFRLLREPNRMWRRYLIGNSRFIWPVIKERLGFS